MRYTVTSKSHLAAEKANAILKAAKGTDLSWKLMGPKGFVMIPSVRGTGDFKEAIDLPSEGAYTLFIGNKDKPAYRETFKVPSAQAVLVAEDVSEATPEEVEGAVAAIKEEGEPAPMMVEDGDITGTAEVITQLVPEGWATVDDTFGGKLYFEGAAPKKLDDKAMKRAKAILPVKDHDGAAYRVIIPALAQVNTMQMHVDGESIVEAARVNGGVAEPMDPALLGEDTGAAVVTEEGLEGALAAIEEGMEALAAGATAEQAEAIADKTMTKVEKAVSGKSAAKKSAPEKTPAKAPEAEPLDISDVIAGMHCIPGENGGPDLYFDKQPPKDGAAAARLAKVYIQLEQKGRTYNALIRHMDEQDILSDVGNGVAVPQAIKERGGLVEDVTPAPTKPATKKAAAKPPPAAPPAPAKDKKPAAATSGKAAESLKAAGAPAASKVAPPATGTSTAKPAPIPATSATKTGKPAAPAKAPEKAAAAPAATKKPAPAAPKAAPAAGKPAPKSTPASEPKTEEPVQPHHFLMFVGAQSYTKEDFIKEADALGVSKRMPTHHIPADLQPGQSYIYLAAAGNRKGEPSTIFGRFMPDAVEFVAGTAKDADKVYANIIADLKSVTGSRIVRDTSKEPERKCGTRKVGGTYLVAKAAESASPVELIAEQPYVGGHFRGVLRLTEDMMASIERGEGLQMTVEDTCMVCETKFQTSKDSQMRAARERKRMGKGEEAKWFLKCPDCMKAARQEQMKARMGATGEAAAEDEATPETVDGAAEEQAVETEETAGAELASDDAPEVAEDGAEAANPEEEAATA